MGQTPIRGPETPKTLPTTWLRDFENAAGQYELRKNVDFRESGISVKNMLDPGDPPDPAPRAVLFYKNVILNGRSEKMRCKSFQGRYTVGPAR